MAGPGSSDARGTRGITPLRDVDGEAVVLVARQHLPPRAARVTPPRQRYAALERERLQLGPLFEQMLNQSLLRPLR